MAEQQQLSGPHIQLAVLCEKVLIERDGVPSIIRIIDRFNISGSTPEMPPNQITFTMFISFKSGFYRGKAALKVNPISPSGKELPAMTFPVLFEGDDERGVFIQANMAMLIQEEGLYWFDLLLQGLANHDLQVTRVPMRVVYQQLGFATSQKQN
jgi:hypothetical protein